MRPFPACAIFAVFTVTPILAAAYARDNRPTPQQLLDPYVRAVNANGFDAQYALFASVEPSIRGNDPTPIPLLPKRDLRRLLARFDPPFPRDLQLSAQPLQSLRSFQKGGPDIVSGLLVPVLAPGRPAPPRGRHTGSFGLFVQQTPQGWKIRALATYWMYYDRAYGSAVGQRFVEAYRQAALMSAHKPLPLPLQGRGPGG
jgi:hypothetical protein